jgi:hypothetical protein
MWGFVKPGSDIFGKRIGIQEVLAGDGVAERLAG